MKILGHGGNSEGENARLGPAVAGASRDYGLWCNKRAVHMKRNADSSLKSATFTAWVSLVGVRIEHAECGGLGIELATVLTDLFFSVA